MRKGGHAQRLWDGENTSVSASVSASEIVSALPLTKGMSTEGVEGPVVLGENGASLEQRRK